jgi:hypothetical protein
VAPIVMVVLLALYALFWIGHTADAAAPDTAPGA